MMIFKFLVIFGIIGISSYLGILKSKSFEIRVEELKKIQSSLNMFKSKIEFTYEPIKDIFEEISAVIYLNQSNIFQNTVLEMNHFDSSQAWYQAIDITPNHLNREDKSTLKMLGKLLGKTDKSGQISEIALSETLIEKQIEKAEQERNKNTKLYKTLGTVLGLGISIILI